MTGAMPTLRRSSAGFSFIELVIATAIMMVLASAALPLARVSIKRQKEVELYTGSARDPEGN